MDVKNLVTSCLLAVGILLVALPLVSGVVKQTRRKNYSRYEDASAEEIELAFPLPSAQNSFVSDELKSLSVLASEYHRDAVKAQDRYFTAVVCSATCISLAFLALVLSTSKLHEMEFLKYGLAWLDFLSIAFLLAFFFWGRLANAKWIRARSVAELLRQYQFFVVLFPGAVSHHGSPHDLTSQFDAETTLVKTRIEGSAAEKLPSEIQNFWSIRKRDIENAPLGPSDVKKDALILYLHRRARRQLGWFIDSQRRIKTDEIFRQRSLLFLYLCTAFLAFVKLVMTLTNGDPSREHRGMVLPTVLLDLKMSGSFHEILPNMLLPLLLIITGLSGVMTAYYINQNLRSLHHRYHTQERFIRQHLEGLKAIINDLPRSVDFDESQKDKVRDFILAFEKMMVEELVDWIHISSHDSIELAP